MRLIGLKNIKLKKRNQSQDATRVESNIYFDSNEFKIPNIY
jgi:hypothetical protein